MSEHPQSKQDVVAAHWEPLAELIDATVDDGPDWNIHDNDVLDGGCGSEWLVLTDEEADARAREYIQQSLWAFLPSFLAGQTGLDESVFQAIADNGNCESNNDAIAALVKGTCGLDEFADAAIGADGRAHFLSGYDGQEHEVTCGGETLYLYRVN